MEAKHVCLNANTYALREILLHFRSGIFVGDAVVGCPVVSKVSLSVICGVLSDKLVQGLPVSSVNDLEGNVTATLHCAYHDGLFPCTPAIPSVLPPTKVSSISTIPFNGSG